MTTYFGASQVDLQNLPDANGWKLADPEAPAEVIVKTVDRPEDLYFAHDHSTETNISRRHSYKVLESGALEVSVTAYSPEANAHRSLLSQSHVVRVYSPLGYLTVEGQRGLANEPAYRLPSQPPEVRDTTPKAPPAPWPGPGIPRDAETRTVDRDSD